MVKYAIAIVIAIAALGFLFAVDASAWEPDECSDEDREIPGNRQSPCKLVLPELTEVEYRVRMDYPVCMEELVFHMPGMTPPLLEALRGSEGMPSVRLTGWQPYGTNGTGDRYPHGFYPFEYISSHDSDTPVVGENHLTYGRRWELGASIPGWSEFDKSSRSHPLTAMGIYVAPVSNYASIYTVESNPVPHPDTSAVAELINNCFDLVQQEKKDREHAAAIERQNIESQARLAAQRDADIKAELQAQREAESQALMAKQELQATLESKARISRTELLKTETLGTQIAHEEVIADILRDIVRIRLAGEEDRVRLTNEYLSRSESVSAAFEVETEETEALIQQYIAFNVQLLGRIEEYQSAIDSRLENVQVRIAEQQAEIAKIEMDAKAIAIELEGTREGQ